MINCYKILEVPDFSDSAVIRKSYLKLAKRYHPDVAGPSAGERFKVISMAYDTLTDPKAKRIHDQRLRYGGVLKKTPTKPKTDDRRRSSEDIAKKRAEYERVKLHNDLAYYKRQNERLPYRFRAVGWGVLGFLGWQLVYQNWFVNEEGFDFVLAFIGILTFIISGVGILSVTYKLFRFQHFTGGPVSFFKKSARITGVYLLLGILLLPVLNVFRKSYHLRNYGVYEVVRFESRNNSPEVSLVYRTNEHPSVIVKKVTLRDEHIYNWEKRWVLVKLSKANPRIIELVEKDSYPLPDPTK
ncbi:MAG: J domain-containing protein [Bacteroidia bacterium]|nr:J domain-containing protein [Bacteroidia bacterium]